MEPMHLNAPKLANLAKRMQEPDGAKQSEVDEACLEMVGQILHNSKVVHGDDWTAPSRGIRFPYERSLPNTLAPNHVAGKTPKEVMEEQGLSLQCLWRYKVKNEDPNQFFLGCNKDGKQHLYTIWLETVNDIATSIRKITPKVTPAGSEEPTKNGPTDFIRTVTTGVHIYECGGFNDDFVLLVAALLDRVYALLERKPNFNRDQIKSPMSARYVENGHMKFVNIDSLEMAKKFLDMGKIRKDDGTFTSRFSIQIEVPAMQSINSGDDFNKDTCYSNTFNVVHAYKPARFKWYCVNQDGKYVPKENQVVLEYIKPPKTDRTAVTMVVTPVITHWVPPGARNAKEAAVKTIHLKCMTLYDREKLPDLGANTSYEADVTINAPPVSENMLIRKEAPVLTEEEAMEEEMRKKRARKTEEEVAAMDFFD